jgi:uncharacterized protein YbcC (UPF0753/DUF2309 family)
MSNAINNSVNVSNTAQAALNAVDKIAPSWPLDQMIAVNPLWSLRNKPFKTVSAELAALGGRTCLWGAGEYMALYKRGDITDDALLQAAKLDDSDMSITQLVDALQSSTTPVAQWKTILSLVDQNKVDQQAHSQDTWQDSWGEAITQYISQFCAAHYQQQQPLLQQKNGTALYQHWLTHISNDRGVGVSMSSSRLHQQFAELPNSEHALIEMAVSVLGVQDDVVEDYFHSLLLDISGWASYVAYLRWQQALGEKDSSDGQDDGIALLAIRLAWDLVLYKQSVAANSALSLDWQQEQLTLADSVAEHKQHQQILWIWARALELSEQQRLQSTIKSSYSNIKPQSSDIKLQALFCIDVRSEVIRRALESQSEGIQTLGFAGFFGLPIAYQPQYTNLSRPQLPGLLAPAITARQSNGQKHGQKNSALSTIYQKIAPLKKQAHWQRWGQSAGSGFSQVESAGWLYGIKMLKQTFFPQAEESPLDQLSHHGDWELYRDDQPLSVDDKATLCSGILSVMGITDFADTVLLVGHGSHSANNLHAAGLNCGACGGQTGEVNVRVLAQLLNDSEIRAALADKHRIPSNTQFIAALHNTTTEEITCFAGMNNIVMQEIQQWLQQATAAAQQDRAPTIDPSWPTLSAPALHKKFIQQSHDWSQVRPEWGLANNNAFIIAPRAWTKQANLRGRVFLHDYQHQKDTSGSTLELLMTAPMIVTHWINMQYNASTTDNDHYGSGNKVLHNAVGGNVGVFEGNGGDLRIGLSKQSLHNGTKWMHTPQRLCVYIAAPQSNISKIVERHEMLQQLINNEWIYVFSWQPEEGIVRFFEGE